MENQNKVLDLASVEAKMLVELQGFKEKQLKVVEENPFIEIIDRASYELAKKNRTNLVKARTGYQNQEKVVKDKLNAIKKGVSELLNEEVIAITKPHEEKQQEEVKRYEAILEEKRQEKAEKERVRVQKHQDSISSLNEELCFIADTVYFENIEESKERFKVAVKNFQEENDLEEFSVLADEKIDAAQRLLDQNINIVTSNEERRLKDLELSQKAEVMKHFEIGTRIVQEATFEGRKNLVDNVKKSFDTEFDFGGFSLELEEKKEYIISLAEKKFSDFEKEVKQREERKIELDTSTQNSNLSDLQNHLMNTIINMDKDNYEISIIDIDSLKKERVGYNYIESKFDSMVAIIEKQQEEKLEKILSEMKSDAEAIEIRLQERIDMISMLGLKRAGNLMSGFDYTIEISEIENINDSDFNEILSAIQNWKNDLQNIEQRKEKIAPDVDTIKAFLQDLSDSTDWSVPQSLCSTKEAIDFITETKREFGDFISEKFKKSETI